MDIDKLVWAIDAYEREVKSNNQALSGNITAQARMQLEQLNKDARRKLEDIFNECVDERVRVVLKELGLLPT